MYPAIAMLGLLFMFTVVSIGNAMKRTRGALPPGGGPADRPEHVRRMLKHLVRGDIATLVDGAATVVRGRASGEPALIAPLSGTPCIGYHVTIRTGYTQQLLHDNARCADFALTDKTGRLDVKGLNLDLAITRAEPNCFGPPFPAWLAQLVPYGVAEIHVREGLLRAGDEVFVCGVVETEVNVDGYRDGDTRTRAMAATPTFPLVASTDMDLERQGDRPIDPEELPR